MSRAVAAADQAHDDALHLEVLAQAMLGLPIGHPLPRSFDTV